MSDQTRLIAGAMSGTSGDGVDVAIVRITGRGLDMSASLLHHHHVPFDASIRSTLFAIRDTQQLRLSDLAKLGREISLTYARAINESLSAANLRSDELSAVAAHGQTLYHDPPNTIQWFDPSLVAAEVGCAVVSDFRRADCAAGGQGAPLVPFADYILFRDPKKNRLVVNIGGIANVTLLFAGAPIERVAAFDTGPGNCISDYLMRTYGPHGPGIDIDGELAQRGQVNIPLAKEVNRHPFFTVFLPPRPKSTDGPAMIEIFQQALARSPARLSLEDQLATASFITAINIAWARRPFGMQPEVELIVSGGGLKNRAVMSELKRWAPDVYPSDDLGVPSDAKEALAFALLGAATLDGVPSNVPNVTGARRAVVLGSITPKP